ncbi:MAG: potassium channel family protein [Bacillota bacterium]
MIPIYILIAGGGIAGRNLIKKLVEKHDVVVIDLDKDICERIYSRYGAISVQGNATRIDVLKDAGISQADVAVGVMRNDADNLAFTVLAKNFGVEKILVRMREPEYENAYHMAGATNVGAVMDLLAERFVVDIEEPRIRKVASLGGGRAEVSIITIPDDSPRTGQSIADIVSSKEFPTECVIAGIYDTEKDRLIIPRGKREINAGNQVFLVATNENMIKAANYLMGKK